MSLAKYRTPFSCTSKALATFDSVGAVGFNTLTSAFGGLGESGGTRSDCKRMPKDVDTAVEFLMSWAGVDRMADKLRSMGCLPMIFDFDRPTDRDLTETVKILAGLSRFAIADITNPRSVPLELQATVLDYMVPFVTILQGGQPAFGMFDDLPRKYHWHYRCWNTTATIRSFPRLSRRS